MAYLGSFLDTILLFRYLVIHLLLKPFRMLVIRY